MKGDCPMVNHVILTVSVSGKELDLEFSATVPIGEVKPILADALKQKGVPINADFSFVFNGKTLSDAESFGSLGIWDGNYIQVC